MYVCLSLSPILFAVSRDWHVSLWLCPSPPLFQPYVRVFWLSVTFFALPARLASFPSIYPTLGRCHLALFCFSFCLPSFTPTYSLTVHFITFFCNLCLSICGQLFTVWVLLFIAHDFFISFSVPLPTATIKFFPSCRKRCPCTTWTFCIHAVIDLEMLSPSCNIPCTHTNSHEKWRIKTQACRR